MLVKIVNRLRSFLSSCQHCHHGHHVIISCHHYFQHCHEDTHEQHSLGLTGLLYVLRSYLPLSLSVTGCPQFAVQRFVRPDVWSGRSGVIIDEATVMRAGLLGSAVAWPHTLRNLYYWQYPALFGVKIHFLFSFSSETFLIVWQLKWIWDVTRITLHSISTLLTDSLFPIPISFV